MSLSKLEMIKLFKMVKYPVQDLHPPLTHTQKVRRLYRTALKLSIPPPWGSHLSLPYVLAIIINKTALWQHTEDSVHKHTFSRAI
jgi:hypothetical protein